MPPWERRYGRKDVWKYGRKYGTEGPAISGACFTLSIPKSTLTLSIVIVAKERYIILSSPGEKKNYFPSFSHPCLVRERSSEGGKYRRLGGWVGQTES